MLDFKCGAVFFAGLLGPALSSRKTRLTLNVATVAAVCCRNFCVNEAAFLSSPVGMFSACFPSEASESAVLLHTCST